ncbi:MAG: GNAT family N-acetyltransferase [Ilumatobacter sp.]|uniref:GNAT family N-acetyltransferase n=1 Tax=Ilumatobacter sp. TaxID=1967498 RepID=UPI0039187F6C
MTVSAHSHRGTQSARRVSQYIINMFVRPDRQRRGVGARLLLQCLEGARELGVSKLALNSTDEGRHLHESAGFRPTQNWMALAVPPNDSSDVEPKR